MQMRAREGDKNANSQQELVDLLLAETVKSLYVYFVIIALCMHILLTHLLLDSRTEWLL